MSVLKTVIHKTVDTFGCITDRRLWVKNDKKVATDGNMISAPLNDPNALRFVEKMLAHILFQTNQEMISQFCSLYTTKVASICASAGLPLNAEQRESFRRLLTDLSNVLEVHRVLSLWSIVYEGSYAEIKALKKQIVNSFALQAHVSLPMLTVVREAEVPIPVGKLSALVPVVDEALLKVEGKGPAATPAVVKWLVVKLVDHLLANQNAAAQQTARPNALHKLVDGTGPLPDTVQNYYAQVKPNTFNSGTFAKSIAKKDAEQALAAPVADEALDDFLKTTAEKMTEAVQKAKQSMGLANGGSVEESITKDASAKVVFHEVTASNVTPQGLLLPEDDTVVKRLRRTFEQIRTQRKFSVYTSGLLVDSMACIQRVVSQQPRPIFKEEIPGRGFDVMVLMDRSSSMGGPKKAQVERAGRMLAKALDYPFVNLHMWGFQSLEPGQVDIFRFQPDLEAYDSAQAQVGGFTPLHIATHVAWRFLARSRNVCHLFVLSDGVPNYHGRNGLAFNREKLVEYVRAEVRSARSYGIGVTGAVIETIKPQKVDGKIQMLPDYSRRHYQKAMFGSEKHWRYLDSKNIGLDLVRLVSSSFAEYLRGT